MERLPKFRVWNNRSKKIVEAGVLDLESGRAMDYYNFYDGYAGESITINSENPLMQFTGLIDKNGAEVYEGDIVKCTSGCPHVVEWRQELGEEYGGGMPGFYLSGLRARYAWMGTEEVVGNIYQNPELLK